VLREEEGAPQRESPGENLTPPARLRFRQLANLR